MRISDWSSDVCSSDLQPGDDIALVIALSEVDVEPLFAACCNAVGFDILERLAAVDARFPLAQHVEVRAVEDDDRLAHVLYCSIKKSRQPIDCRTAEEKPRLPETDRKSVV